MDIKRIQSKFEVNDDYELFNLETQLKSKLISMKQRAFNLCGSFVPTTFVCPTAAALLVFISFLQFVSILLATFYYEAYNTDNTFVVLQYLRLFPAIQEINSKTLLICYIIFISLTVVVLSGTIVLKIVFGVSVNVTHAVPIVYWTGFLPVLESLLGMWKCDALDARASPTEVICLSQGNIARNVITGVLILLWISVIVLYTLVSTHSQPYKCDPFAHLPWNFETIYTLLRLAILLEYKCLDQTVVRTPISVAALLYFLAIMWEGFPYYDSRVSLAFVCGLCCVIISVLLVALRYWSGIFDAVSIGDVKILIVSTFLLAIILKFRQSRWYYYLIISNNLKAINEMDAKMHILANIIADGRVYSRFQERYLESQEPSGPTLAETNHDSEIVTLSPEGHNSQSQHFAILSARSFLHKPELVAAKSKTRDILISLIKTYAKETEEFGNSASFLYQLSSAYLNINKNIHLAYETLVKAEELETSLTLEFTMHMHKLEILNKSRQRSEKLQRSGGFNKFEAVAQFESEYNNMKRKMASETSLRMDFWTNLQNKSSLNVLHKLGIEMINLNSEVKESWEKLVKIYPRNVSALKLCKSYYKNVMGDGAETEQIRKTLQSSMPDRFKGYEDLFSEKTAVVTISSDQKIIRANRATQKVFSYDPKALCGRHLSLLMPPILGSQHKKFMDAFYERGSERSMGKKIESFAVDRHGYILPVKVAKKQFYSLVLGMVYIGTIEVDSALENTQYIMADSKGQIGGITRDLSKKLKLSPKMISNKRIILHRLCESEDGRDLMSIQGDAVLKFRAYAYNRSIVPTELSAGNNNEGERTPRIVMSEKTAFMAKCDFCTIRYSEGFSMMTIRIDKQLSCDTRGKKNGITIQKEMISSVTTIMRTLRKFKALAFRARKKRESQATTLGLPSQQSDRRKSSCATDGLNSSLADTRVKGDCSTSTHPLLQLNGKLERMKTLAKATLKGTDANSVRESSTIGLLRNQEDLVTNMPGEALKQIASMRKNNILDEFYPDSIWYLKIVTELGIAAVLALLLLRMGVSIWVNTKVSNSAPLIQNSGLRVLAFGMAGMLTEELTMVYPFLGSSTSLIKPRLRQSIYDYSEVVPQLGLTGDETFKQLLIGGLQYVLEQLYTCQLYINDWLRTYKPSFADSINVPNVVLEYNLSGQAFNTTLSLNNAVMTIVADTTSLLNKVKRGEYDPTSHLSLMVIDLQTCMTKYIRLSLDAIVTDAYEKIDFHRTFALGILIALIVIFCTYFVTLIPFLILTNRNLESMLMLLLDIPHAEIKEERERTMKFMKRLCMEASVHHKGVNLDDDVPVENDDGSLTPGDHESSNGDAKSEDSSEFTSNTSGKRKSRRKKRHHARYKSNVWRILLLFGAITAFALGLYYGIDYLMKQETKRMAFKITELRYLSRNSYANAFCLPYIYKYIMTNKTGICCDRLCSQYLPAYFQLRLNELVAMINMHKGNISLMSNEYNTYYSNVMENNPCKLTSLGLVKNCSTLMGGMFAQGTLAASLWYGDLAFSVFRDFEKSDGSLETIREFVNDRRLTDLEVMYLELLWPAYELLIQYVRSSLEQELTRGITTTSVLIMLFAAIFLVAMIIWLVWLVRFMRRTMFDTKSLLSNLPDQVILQNRTIYSYLSSISINVS